MKLIPNRELSKIAEELESFVCIDEVLEGKGICCISQCVNEFYDDDDEKWIKFVSQNLKKDIFVFHGYDFSYYAAGSLNKIKQILKEELKAIKDEEKSDS